MPNVFKFNTSTDEKSLRRGNFSIGVGDVSKGRSVDTGFYNGITPPEGGWTIYHRRGDTNNFGIYTASTSNLVSLTNQLDGKTFTQVWECLNHFAGTSSRVILNKDFAPIVTDGLVFFYDASNTLSYPTTASVWYDISGNLNTGTMEGSPELSLSSWFLFDGTDDRVTVPNSSSLQVTGDQTLEFLVRPDSRSARRNWYEKSYGGEGTITYETNGSLTYFWGTAGSDTQPYQGVATTGTPLAATGSWYHVVLVRELSTPTKTVKWYINGVLNRSVSASYTAAVASTKQVQLGNGYTNRFIGGMVFARQYNKALSLAQVSQNYYGGSIVTSDLILAFDASNPVSYPREGVLWTSLIGGATSSLTNGPIFDTGNGGNIVCDGNNDYIITQGTPAALQGDPNFTISMWVRRLRNEGTNTGIWGFGGNVTNQGINSWWFNNSNEITIDSWGQATFTTGQTYPLNEWVYVTWQKIAGAMTRANCILWRNLASYTGNQLTILRAENVAPNINNNGVTLGRISNSYGTPVNFGFAHVVVYNRVLTPDEISQNYAATKWRFGL